MYVSIINISKTFCSCLYRNQFICDEKPSIFYIFLTHRNLWSSFNIALFINRLYNIQLCYQDSEVRKYSSNASQSPGMLETFLKVQIQIIQSRIFLLHTSPSVLSPHFLNALIVDWLINKRKWLQYYRLSMIILNSKALKVHFQNCILEEHRKKNVRAYDKRKFMHIRTERKLLSPCNRVIHCLNT